MDGSEVERYMSFTVQALNDSFPEGASIGFGGYQFNQIEKIKEDECTDQGGKIYQEDLCVLPDYCEEEG